MLAVPILLAPYNGFPRTLNMRASLSSALEDNDTQSGQKIKTTVTMTIKMIIQEIKTILKMINHLKNLRIQKMMIIQEKLQLITLKMMTKKYWVKNKIIS